MFKKIFENFSIDLYRTGERIYAFQGWSTHIYPWFGFKQRSNNEFSIGKLKFQKFHFAGPLKVNEKIAKKMCVFTFEDNYDYTSHISYVSETSETSKML